MFCRWKVIVPQNSRACICTGMWRGSSVYQIQMLAAVLHHAFVGGRLHFDGLEGSRGCLDLLARFRLHADGDGAHGVGQREVHRLADGQRLRLRVEDRRKGIA